jgi:glutamate formiminotransferase
MIVECVPNFSTDDERVVSLLCDAISAVPGICLFDCTSDRDHNRSVITFAGAILPVERAALAAAEVAVREIDLNRHFGVHPRIGSIDVLPFVPVDGISVGECAELAVRVASNLWEHLHLPAFLYEAAKDGKGLEVVRREAREGSRPDFGVDRHPTAGAVAVGAREFLIAWNIHLKTRDLEIAKSIARSVRFSSGGFPGVKALGLPLDSLGCVQVSINSTDYRATPLHIVFERVVKEAGSFGVEVAGSELIGLIPVHAMKLSAGHDLRWLRFEPGFILENALQLKKC